MKSDDICAPPPFFSKFESAESFEENVPMKNEKPRLQCLRGSQRMWLRFLKN